MIEKNKESGDCCPISTYRNALTSYSNECRRTAHILTLAGAPLLDESLRPLSNSERLERWIKERGRG